MKSPSFPARTAGWPASVLFALSTFRAAAAGQDPPSTWPQSYTVARDTKAGVLRLATPYYAVEHNLKKGGAISSIRLTHGQATNLLVAPLQTRIEDKNGIAFTDEWDFSPSVSHSKRGLTRIVSVNSRLVDEKGRPSGIRLKTLIEYHWGYLKVHKEFVFPKDGFQLRELSPVSTLLAPGLTEYGYREGVTEQEGAKPFSFGSCVWGKLRTQTDKALNTVYVPRYLMLADPGVEGLEWFVGSDLCQWDLQLTGRRGQGRCVLRQNSYPAGLVLQISPFYRPEAPVRLSRNCAFDFYIGVPILEEHAFKPWLHTGFNRNRGEWVSPEQIRRWAEQGIQTVHCHNDGDYYDDGLFWRDGSYPPYPDMTNYDRVITNCHQENLRVATYFSNKELHPSTGEFALHGSEWGRKDAKGNLQHNFFRGKSEFGVQMCLRSGWLDFLKFSIDRVLKHSPLDGVYYDWNVALLCCNPLHEGKIATASASGHWDIDELLDLMEWTRQRVGPRGLIIVHNTTTPMLTTENFANYVVANEWGYGKWSERGPELADLPLEWSLLGARSRGVISYGQIDDKAPRRLHQIFALEAFLAGVSPWPASPQALKLNTLLTSIGDLESCKFADWRNQAVTLKGGRCGSCIYSRPGEAYVLLANLDQAAQNVLCTVRPEKLPFPLKSPTSAVLLDESGAQKEEKNLDARDLTSDGVQILIPGDSAVLLRIR